MAPKGLLTVAILFWCYWSGFKENVRASGTVYLQRISSPCKWTELSRRSDWLLGGD